jgi:hypothetical protein
MAQAATGDTLLVHLRIKLGQTNSSNSNWTDNQLIACMNMAQDWISAQGRAIEKTDTTAGDTVRYTARTDFIKLKGTAWLWRNGQEVKPLPVISADSAYRVFARMGDLGFDEHYVAEDGGQVMVVPKLSSSDSLVISYYATATKLTTAGECSYGPEWEQVLLVTAKAIALEKIDSPLWPAAVQERDKLLAAMYRQQTLKPQLVEVP